VDYFEFSTQRIPYGAGILYAVGCFCPCCIKIRELIDKGGMITSGGWADPRRGYSESEKDFLERVPDGFIKWHEDHDK
jgi:hypothetical protein